jgi:hypothetical protein
VTREHAPVKNELLAALTRGAYPRLLPHLKSVSPPLGTLLYNSGESIERVYFSQTADVAARAAEG